MAGSMLGCRRPLIGCVARFAYTTWDSGPGVHIRGVLRLLINSLMGGGDDLLLPRLQVGVGVGADLLWIRKNWAYSAAELKTYHCERVRKMPMSGLDPSMLIGFLCRDKKDWWDFKKRVADVCFFSFFLSQS
jgi:hypothetical protein